MLAVRNSTLTVPEHSGSQGVLGQAAELLAVQAMQLLLSSPRPLRNSPSDDQAEHVLLELAWLTEA